MARQDLNTLLDQAAPATVQRESGLSISIAPQLPAAASVLSPRMQDCARRALDADRKGGQALLDKAAALAEARAAAEHGEWSIFLETIGVHERAARRLVAIHERADQDARFAGAVRSGWLSFSVAALTAQADDTLLEQLLTQDEPPTRAQIAGATVKPDTGVRFDQPAAILDPPTLPAHLAAAGYRWQATRQPPFVIIGPDGWAGNAPTVAGALSLAEDRYQAQQPTAQDRLPDAPDGWRWASNRVGEHLLRCEADGWETRAYRFADRAVAEAQRRVLSQPQQAAAPEEAPWSWEPALVALKQLGQAMYAGDRAAALGAAYDLIAALEA